MQALLAFSIVVVSLCLCVSAKSVREALLREARLRIDTWHANRSLLEKPLEKSGISLTMLKHDLKCGDMDVPVGFAEFEVVGARPVDVFNTVMNISNQPSWNPKASSVILVGSWPNQGARGWDNTFNLIFEKQMEFLVWQVADADFEKEEFWMATSTSNNHELRELSPRQPNWISSDNCLGAYRIRKSERGASVVVTQHVNTRLGFWFPFHEVLEVFPIAWQGMVVFIQALMKASCDQASIDWPSDRTVAPSWMLPESKDASEKKESASEDWSMAFRQQPLLQKANEWQSWAILGLVVSALGACLCMIFLVRSCGKCSTREYSQPPSEAGSACDATHRSSLSDFDSECDIEGCESDSACTS